MIIKVKDIRKGARFSESCYGQTLHFEAIMDAYILQDDKHDGWQCIGAIVDEHGTVTKHTVTFFQSSAYPAYGPNLCCIDNGASF